MRAGRLFLEQISDRIAQLAHLECDLYGSLALTGIGHGTDNAVLLGLSGELPELIDVDCVPTIIDRIHATQELLVDGRFPIKFSPGTDLRMRKGVFLPGHSNAMVFTATFSDGEQFQQEFHSIGGGEVVTIGAERPGHPNVEPRYGFRSAGELLELADQAGISIADVVRANETAWRTPEETDAVVDAILTAMAISIDRGCAREGILPGGLKVTRRAPGIFKVLSAKTSAQQSPSVRLGESMGSFRQRGKRRSWTRRHGADKRSGRRDPRSAALLPNLHSVGRPPRHEGFYLHRRGDWVLIQEARLDLGG
jgi:L-serine dehydratase